MQRLRESPELAASLEAAISNPESKAFPHALKAVTDYDTEKPAQRVQIDVNRLSEMTDEELAAIVKGKK